MADFSRAALEQHSLDMRQFIEFRLSTLPNGQRIVEAHNSSGLSFTVLPDRGLDIWSAWHNGRSLTWISPGSPHAADYGASWLRQFNGGLLTTCGLLHVGPPETDPLTGTTHDLHGHYSRLSAQELAISGGWQPEGYVLELRGVMQESVLFGVQTRLTRTLRLILGQPMIEIVDLVENRHDTPVPLMLLYHFNPGYPLVRQGARLLTPTAAVYPRDAAARAGLERWSDYDAGQAGYQEQVFFHHVRADAAYHSMAALLNDEFGLLLEWDVRSAPYLTQWKNTRRGIYVCGIEPGNCIPEGQQAARDRNRLVLLQPGETRRFFNRLSVLPDADSMARATGRIQQQQRLPVAGCHLEDYA